VLPPLLPRAMQTPPRSPPPRAASSPGAASPDPRKLSRLRRHLKQQLSEQQGKLLDAVAAAPSADEVFDFVSLHARIHDLQADLKTVDEACRAAVQAAWSREGRPPPSTPPTPSSSSSPLTSPLRFATSRRGPRHAAPARPSPPLLCLGEGGSSSPGLVAARGARIVSAAVAEAEAALEAWRPGGKGVTTGAVASSASPPAPTGLDRLFRKILCGADVDALAESILRDNDALLDNWKLVVQ